jgi:hypothetical protein
MITAENVKDLFDYRDGKLFWTDKIYHKSRAGTEAGAILSDGYRGVKYKGKRYPAHRVIWLWNNGAWPTGDVDHINGDRADNRIKNLRDVTRSENIKNQRRELVGIHHRKNGDYEATYCGKYLGRYKDLALALEARHGAELADPAHLRTAQHG